MSKKMAAVAAVTGIAASLLVVGPAVTSASAASVICEPNSKTVTWASVTKPWGITHAEQHENYTGSPETRTESVSKVTVLSGTITYSTGAKANISLAKVMGSLEGHTDLSLAASGSKTTKKDLKVTSTMAKQGVYIYYAGRRRATGWWTGYQCNGNGTKLTTVATGTAQSYSINADGAIWCKAKPSKSSLGYAVKKKYC
jgi:hypothetical protein